MGIILFLIRCSVFGYYQDTGPFIRTGSDNGTLTITTRLSVARRQA